MNARDNEEKMADIACDVLASWDDDGRDADWYTGEWWALHAALSDAGYLVVRITPETRERAIKKMARALAGEAWFYTEHSERTHWLRHAAAALTSALAVLTAEREA